MLCFVFAYLSLESLTAVAVCLALQGYGQTTEPVFEERAKKEAIEC